MVVIVSTTQQEEGKSKTEILFDRLQHSNIL